MERNKENTEIEKRVATIFNLTSLISDPKLVLEALGLVSSKVYKTVPKQCSICKHKYFAEVSLLGVSPKSLLWECLDCKAMFLKYSKAWVVKQFAHIEDIWTNLSDWEVPDKNDFN
tara:strand:- start:11270 stop:11617 length:348 start_codon:yes stop_codon:yes gene_type:complete